MLSVNLGMVKPRIHCEKALKQLRCKKIGIFVCMLCLPETFCLHLYLSPFWDEDYLDSAIYWSKVHSCDCYSTKTIVSDHYTVQ